MKSSILAIVLLFAAPAYSHAALVKPESAEGKRIVHKVAGQISKAFVNQTDFLVERRGDALDCESTKAAILKEIDRLDVKKNADLVDAKGALERANCNDKDFNDRKFHDHLFTATVYLRSADSL